MREQYKHCIVCGKSFRYTHESRKFCSETCYHEHNKKAGRIKELEKELEQKDAEIEQHKKDLQTLICECDAARKTWQGYWRKMFNERIAELEAIVQELAENAADYYTVSVKDAIKLATERVKENKDERKTS